MAKSSGLGDYLWIGGNDLSSDTQSGKMTGSVALLEFTAINNLAHVRQGGQRSADIQWVSYFDATGAHPVLSALPTTDTLATYVTNTGSPTSSIGNSAYCIRGLQLNYDPTRNTAGDLTMAITADSDGAGGEWGYLLTPGIRDDTAATNGTAFDRAGGFSTPAVPLTTVPVQNISGVPFSVVISAGTVTLVTVNGTTVGTGDGTYTVPAGASIAVTYSVAPTWAWTAVPPSYGAQAYLHVFSFTGTDATVKVQHSSDNSSWSDLMTFSQTTASPGWQREAVANTAAVDQYVRAVSVTSAGFTVLNFAVIININSSASVGF